ncbi:MAG TPA: permease, partial [Flexistipes sinusarabici]|nr:permease [Flexistipes sinusarabici]
MHSKGFVFATVLLGFMAVVLTTLAYFRGDGAHIEGLKSAFRLTLNILPLIFFAMIIGGMIQILIPKDLIMNWIGSGSGIRGVVIGSLAGGITPGAPYVSY